TSSRPMLRQRMLWIVVSRNRSRNSAGGNGVWLTIWSSLVMRCGLRGRAHGSPSPGVLDGLVVEEDRVLVDVHATAEPLALQVPEVHGHVRPGADAVDGRARVEREQVERGGHVG